MHNDKGNRVTELWAYVFVDAAGDEGVARRDTPIGTQPLIADDLTRAMAHLGAEAQRVDREIARPEGGRLKLVRFVKEKEIDPAFNPPNVG